MIIQKYLDGARYAAFERLKSRFWEKVLKSEGCWEWKGAKNQYGRGLFRVGRCTSAAPRVAYALAYLPVPRNLFVLHSCDNPGCVNPEHLRLGTHQENMEERDRKGRTSKWRLRNTHCPQNHPYSGDNLKIDTRGSRTCRECHRTQEKMRRKRLTANKD